MRKILFMGLVCLAAARSGMGCDLCAVYGASTAREVSGEGLVVTLSELYVPHDRAQFEGREVHPLRVDHWESFTTHVVPGYNFTANFGVSLNLPVVVNEYRRTDLVYSLSAPPVTTTTEDTEAGLGDAALIGRYTVFRKRDMDRGITVNVMGGIKFPTGETGLIREEIAQGRVYDRLVPPGRPHDPLGHSISGVHLHELSPGSGSFDGIFGLTTKGYLGRWFFDAQFQYYLRTEGESGFRRGDDWMVSGGPGRYVWSGGHGTLSVQVNAAYESESMDSLLGRESARTGMVSWYLGPLMNLTLGDHLLVNAGVDVPLAIENNGFLNVPEYRVRGGVTWRF